MDKEKCAFEVGKTYKTRDGREARVVAVDRKTPGEFPIVALVLHRDGIESVFFYTRKGKFARRGDNAADLLPPREVVWVLAAEYTRAGEAIIVEPYFPNAVPFIRATCEEVEGG